MLNVKIKKLDPKAVVPSYAKEGDAGLDLTTIEEPKREIDQRGCVLTYRTGLSIEIPEGFVGLLFPRSSVSTKTGFSLMNSVGVIDSGYRGEILFKFRDHAGGYSKRMQYQAGDRIGQLIIMPYPQINLIEVDSLSDTERSDGGYGSSGS